MTGKLIAFEGIDGSGKTSILSRLCKEYGDNPKYQFSKEPTRSSTGDACYQAINSGDEILAALAFAVDHRWHIKHVIEPALAAGNHIFTDRYIHSHYAYQVQTLENDPDLDAKNTSPIDWLDAIYTPFTRYPDYVFWFVVDPDEAVNRIKSSRTKDKIDLYETAEFLSKVHTEYQKQLVSNRINADNSVYLVIDTNLKNLDEVYQDVVMCLETLNILPSANPNTPDAPV